MKNYFAMLQALGSSQLRFRDIIQLLLLSTAMKIVDRATKIMNRIGTPPVLPMQNQPQQIGFYGYPMPPQMPDYPFPAQPQIIPYPQPENPEVK